MKGQFRLSHLLLAMMSLVVGGSISVAEEPSSVERELILTIVNEYRQDQALEIIDDVASEQVIVTDTSAAGLKLEVINEPGGPTETPEEICRKLRVHERDERREGKSPLRVSRHCEENQFVSINATPNDPFYPTLWGMQRLQMQSVWDQTVGSNEIVVAVIDTGVQHDHPDLQANMWRNPGEIPGNGRDDDGNGYVDDVFGIDTLNGDSDPMDDNGHGTHVAGTIGAASNNGAGVAGMNWNVRLMALKFLSASGGGSTWGAISALAYVRLMKERGVNVLLSNNSWGGGGYSQSLYDEIERHKNLDMLFVAAAGNGDSAGRGLDNDITPHYPSSYANTNIISVASLQSDGNRSTFSNWGRTSVDLAAPGSGISSTWIGGGYRSISGTSMATPHVSGALAILKAYSSNLSANQLRDRLLQTVSPNSVFSGRVVTGGELNVLAAIQASSSNPLVPPTPTHTPTPLPTATNTPVPTATPIPPTPTATPTPRSGSWTLRVIDEAGAGLGNVSLSIVSASGSVQTATTGADGSVSLSGVAGGTYRVTASRSGFLFEPGELVQFVNGNTESLISAARATYQVRGIVMNRFDAASVPGAQIEVFVDGRLTATFNAAADGAFSTSLPFGSSYRLEVRHPDFYGETIAGTVTGRVSRTVAMLPN